MKNTNLTLAFLLFCLNSHAQSVKQYQNQLDSLHKIGEYAQMLPLGEQMKSVARDSFGTVSIEYYRAIVRLASAHVMLSHFNEAYALRLESKDLIEKLKGKKFIGYANACFNLGLLDQHQSRFESAKVFTLEALEYFRQLFGEKDRHLAWAMIQLGIIDFNLGNYTSALNYDEKSRDLLENLNLVNTEDSANVLINLSALQLALDKISLAEQLARDALESKRQLYSSDTTYTKYWLAKCLLRGSKFEEAELILNQILRSDGAKNDAGRSQVSARQELAKLYEFSGRYPEAEQLVRESLEMEHAIAGKETFLYALGLNQLSECLRHPDKSDEALLYAREALALKEKIFGKTDRTYVISLIEVADCYAKLRQWQPAESTFLEAKSILPQITAYTASFLTDIQSSLGDLYLAAGKHAESRQSYRDAAATMEANHYESFSTQQARVKMMLGMLAGLAGDNAEATADFAAYEKGQNEWIARMLPTLTDVQKTPFLADLRGELAGLYSFQFHEKKQQLAGLLFSRQLIYKNLATSTLEKLNREMENTHDPQAKTDFETWRYVKERLTKMYTLSPTELSQQPDSIPTLENRATDLEKSLSRRSARFAQLTFEQPATWQDLRAALRPGEAALDIARFQYENNGQGTDSVMYALLVVTPETTDQARPCFSAQRQRPGSLPHRAISQRCPQ